MFEQIFYTESKCKRQYLEEFTTEHNQPETMYSVNQIYFIIDNFEANMFDAQSHNVHNTFFIPKRIITKVWKQK